MSAGFFVPALVEITIISYNWAMKTKPTFTFRLGPDFYNKLSDFTDKFLSDGFALFENEFANIEGFLKKARADAGDRDDKDFRLNTREMYLLEALYYEIMDRVNREAFNKSEQTVIILPVCLALMQDKCKRVKTKYGKVCKNCVPNCEVNKICHLAAKYDVKCYFSKRALPEQLEKIKKGKKSMSVIGIACLLTLASGMRSAKELGIPARGVLLNFTGCQHWTDQPIVTETSLTRLEAILKEKYGTKD
jgi:hypothetical protein